MGLFDKIKQGLAKTRAAFSNTLEEVFSNADAIDEDFFEELEETLILADLGVDTSTKAVTRQQFITMLYRYAVDQGYDVSVGEETNILSYADPAREVKCVILRAQNLILINIDPSWSYAVYGDVIWCKRDGKGVC